MYTFKDLTVEIEQVIADYEAKGERRLHPDWITQSVMDLHPNVDGEDADFYRIVSRAQVREAVRQRLNAYRAKPEVSPQLELVAPGYERLQRRYLINEDGEQVAVKVELMTSVQRLAKAAELRAMGAGCFQHADELERFDRDITTAA